VRGERLGGFLIAFRATVVVPVKRFDAAKRRLGAAIEDERRRAIVAAMLEDVLEAVAAARMIERTIVVTGEPTAADAARRTGADVVEDPGDQGQPAAAMIGIAEATADAASCVVLVPGDCPLLDPRDLDRLLTAAPDPYVAVVPDRHGTGTNALLLRPPDAIRPAFGEGSCKRHIAAARSAGLPHGVERLSSLALDLDTPADMIALARELESGRGRAPHTARALGL
jgi:2-phospho-L-lactate/phosphoenolpyruvate guanylyltransferase